MLDAQKLSRATTPLYCSATATTIKSPSSSSLGASLIRVSRRAALAELDEGLLARWRNSYHPSLFAEFEGNDMKIDGRCHCGYVRFEAEADPETTTICNCTDCQTMSGAPLRAIVATRPGTFVLLSGKPTEYRKTADSGNVRLQAFCPHCGTPIYATSTGDEPKAYNVRLGSLRQRNELVPRRQIFVRSQQAWVNDLNSVPKFDGPPH
jgi:hypothetical protein